MKKSDFSFELPENLIAQTPLEKRDASRLLVIDNHDKTVEHRHFYDIVSYLKKGDLLVLNDSKVLPARIFGKKKTGAKMEALLLKQKKQNVWECLVKPGRRARLGEKIVFGENGELTAEIVKILETGERELLFTYEGNFFDQLSKIGQMPLPHYIKEKLRDQNRYQTVYAHELGSSAAPTAGLHFTNELMEEIRSRGIKIAYVTLHVGLGTFRPVSVDEITDHIMHSESYEIPQETAELINETRSAGGKIIAVGTTSSRTLESAQMDENKILAGFGDTDIFIYPGYKFKIVDGLITNFHLPESTLIMLVSAILGRDFTLEVYGKAVEEKYRFYSFGDAMFIKPRETLI